MRSTSIEIPSIIIPRKNKKKKFVTQYKVHIILSTLIGILIVSFNYRNIKECCAFTDQLSTSYARHHNNNENGYRSSKNSTIKVSTTTSNNIIQNDNNVLHFYHKNPSSFLQIFTSCLSDINCYIYYNHIQKTGGTSIEEKMLYVFPFRFNDAGYSCCDDSLLQRFDKHKDEFCNNKFTGYQVNTSSFQYIVDTCHAIHNNNVRRRKARVIVLVTYRDPIQRMISYIHQLCNKNLHWRAPSVQEACARCSYTKSQDSDDEAFWNEHISTSNNIYIGMKTFIDNNVNNKMKVTNILAIDNLDMNQFYSSLVNFNFTNTAQRIDASWLDRLKIIPDTLEHNPENKSTCDFHIDPSNILQLLYPSLYVYQLFSSGYSNNDQQYYSSSNEISLSKPKSTKIHSTPRPNKSLIQTTTPSNIINFHSYPQEYSKLFFNCFLQLLPNCKLQSFDDILISNTDNDVEYDDADDDDEQYQSNFSSPMSTPMFTFKNHNNDEFNFNLFSNNNNHWIKDEDFDEQKIYILLFYSNPIKSYVQTILNLCHNEDATDSSSSTVFNNITFISNIINQKHKDMLSKMQTMLQTNDNNEDSSNTILLLFDETIHDSRHFLEIMVNTTLMKDDDEEQDFDLRMNDFIAYYNITTNLNISSSLLLSSCFNSENYDSAFISSSLLKELSISYEIYQKLASY